MYSTSLCLVLVIALAAANGDKTQSVLREVVKGQLDVIKHCVGLRGYPYRGIPPHPVYPRKRYIVAFQARSSKRLLNLSAKQVVVFDIVDVNKGGGYNAKDGTFKAPFSGVYVFQWTTLARDGKRFVTEFVVDDVIKAMNYAYGVPTSSQPGSQTVVVDMKKGQKAWLRLNTSSGHSMCGIYWSTFTGYLL